MSALIGLRGKLAALFSLTGGQSQSGSRDPYKVAALIRNKVAGWQPWSKSKWQPWSESKWQPWSKPKWQPWSKPKWQPWSKFLTFPRERRRRRRRCQIKICRPGASLPVKTKGPTPPQKNKALENEKQARYFPLLLISDSNKKGAF